MDGSALLKQIKDEYSLWYDYVLPVRQRYRARITKRNPQTKIEWKININMIANAIDVKIASSWSNGTKAKFISRTWWIGAEEADNLNNVAEFDEKESARQQIRYQLEQDSWFFGVWILNRTWRDNVKDCNTRRTVNPLSWIPDPLPSQTGQFDWQNYRFHGFMMRSTVYDMRKKYDHTKLNEYFKSQSESDNELTRQAYMVKWWYQSITCDTLQNNFSMDVYTHYTIFGGKKIKVVTDSTFGHIFHKEELKAVLKEEKLDPMCIPRPVMLNYTDPQRESAFGWSVCDKLEDKQNAKSILFNLNIIKAKKEALWWDFLVNSRLIKNAETLKQQTVDTRYLFVDGDILMDNPIQNAMYELPQSQIKTDSFSMISAIDNEAKTDVKIDQLQAWIAPDKTMTKAEAQQIQGNANILISTSNSIKSRFYQDFYFQRWRGYQEHFKDGKKKFSLLADNFEWKGVSLSKDQFLTRQIPYIMVWSSDDIDAMNEKQKQYINLMYPQVMADQSLNPVCKNIFQRLSWKVNWFRNDTINTIVPYSPSERQAKSYVDMVNLEIMPQSIFSNPDADFFTYWLYLQKAEDNDIKFKILWVLNDMLISEWMQKQQDMMTQDPSMSNSAANIAMSQNQPQQWWDIMSRENASLPSSPTQ